MSLEFLKKTDHRLWPLPNRPWRVRQNWIDLTFLHWRVESNKLRGLLPNGLELDEYEGQAWLGVVPFRMSGVRFRGVPPIPGLSSFPEINVRTYVRCGDKRGIFFFSLDTNSSFTVRYGRRSFHVPYFLAESSILSVGSGWHYQSQRTHLEAPPAEFNITSEPMGQVCRADEGSLLYFLTERYCFYSSPLSGQILRCDVHHLPWPIQDAQVETKRLSGIASLGVPEGKPPELAHFSAGVRVVGWFPVPARA